MKKQALTILLFALLPMVAMAQVSAQAKKEATKLKEVGWQAAPGTKPIAEQIDASRMYQEAEDESGKPKYIYNLGMAVGKDYADARANALLSAKTMIAQQIFDYSSHFFYSTLDLDTGKERFISSPSKETSNDARCAYNWLTETYLNIEDPNNDSTFLKLRHPVTTQDVGNMKIIVELFRKLKNGDIEVQVGLGSTTADAAAVFKKDLANMYSQPKPAANPVAQPVAAPQPPKELIVNVDEDIPVAGVVDKNTFAVVIGNEKYADEADVPFAENDAKMMKEYCQRTLGISEKHIRYVCNATYNDFRKAINWLKQGLTAYSGQGRVIFYYAGHGIPNEADKSACLLPVDGIGSDIESAFPLGKLFQALSELPAQSVTVFLDACFSGAKREGGMMASARGVAIKAKPQEAKGKMVVFTAAQGDETAYPFKSQQHGMFTYYLLRKLQESKGSVTLGDLADYLTNEVKRESFDENSKMQTPSVTASTALQASWRTMKLK